jgi:acyl-CoA thioesterase
VSFDADIAVRELAEGVFEAVVHEHWFIARGPNGGFVAAVILRAMEEALGETSRSPRSLTIHYLRPPQAGPARIETSLERRGSSVATLSARMLQGERLVAIALGAFSPPWPGPGHSELEMPQVPPAAELSRLDDERFPEFMSNYDMRWAMGPRPFSAAAEALAGGWIRTAEPRPVDAAFVAAASDAFVPPIFATLERPAAAPTIDLTIHFRETLPLEGVAPEEHLLGRFRSRLARGGFFDEEGELWAPDGRLVAQSRQLALLIENRPGR